MLTSKYYYYLYNNKDKLIFIIVIFLLLSTLFLKYAVRLEDGDIWFHMAYGRYLLENYTLIPDHTIYSWTPTDGSQIYCAWTAEILFFILYKIGGLTVLFAFRYLCLFMFLFLVWTHAKRNNVVYHPLTWLLCLIGSLMIKSGIQVKPEIFSLILMTLTVWTWWQVKTSPEKGWLYCYLFPIISLVWVNTHGGVIFGMTFLGLLLCGEILNSLISQEEMLPARVRKHFFVAMFFCFIAVFINPYGWRYPAELVQYLIGTQQIEDFKTVIAYQSIFYKPFRTFHFFEYLCVSLFIFSILLWPTIRDRKLDWTLIITNVFFCFLYIKFLRTTYYWSIIFIFSSLYLLSNFIALSIAQNQYVIKSIRLLLLSAFIILVVLENYESISSKDFGFTVEYLCPNEEAEYIQNHFSGYRLGNDYGSGAYILWALWPGTKVFIDARYFPYKHWYKEYTEFVVGRSKEYQDYFINKYKCDVWCLRHNFQQLSYFLNSPDWELVHYGPSACIFISKRLKFIRDTKLVSESIFNVNIYQATPVIKFALKIGDLETAEKILEKLKILSVIPYQKKLYLEANNSLGIYLYSHKHIQESIKAFSRSLKIEPNDPLLHYCIGTALAANNNFQEAIKSYKSAIRLNPKFAEAHYSIGNVLLASKASNSINDAIFHYKEALHINPLYAEAQLNLTKAFVLEKKTSDSISKLQEILKNQPNNIKIMYSLGLLYSYLGEYDKSIKYLNSILQLTPNNASIYYNIACLYSKKNDTEEAVKWLKMAIEKGFNDWSLLEKDSDLDMIRNTKYYKELTKKY